jgi:hypothetical protein
MALVSIGIVILSSMLAQAQARTDSGPVAWWQFDEQSGNFEYVEGVTGKAIKFDGYTTRVTRKADEVAKLTDAFTIEAWVALQTYPWNWTAIVDQQRPAGKTNIFFGIDAYGHVGLKLNLDGRSYQCVSKKKLALLKWSHVAGTFDADKGIAVYVNGENVAEAATQGILQTEGLSDLLIGKSHQKASPVGTERDASRKTMSNMVLDGLLDEVKIYSRALSSAEVAKSFGSIRPKGVQPLSFRKMPSGPKELPKRFGAYYTRLRYADEWEKPWRVGEHPDILVSFDTSPVRVVFWRGTNYGASWVTENDIWMGDQSLEDSGTGWGLSEHMADKQNRYSHVRLIENHDARIVVHWRYAVADIRYTINHTDEQTGWGDWVDEYYYIYPDATAIRKQILWTGSDVDGFQWQETIFFGQPGTWPEDNIGIDAFTLANMDGQIHTYSYADGAPDDYPEPKGANIQLTNLKAKNRPFIIFEPTSEITAFGSGSESSNFPWWNHWPVSMIPSDGRKAVAPDRPFHASLSNYEPRATKGRGDSYIAASLYGMTDRPIETLVALARSWINPPHLAIDTGYPSDAMVACAYDDTQRAYEVHWRERSKPLDLLFLASENSPVVNPALVVKNWGHGAVSLRVDAKEVKRGPDFRIGHHRTLEGTDLIVWIKAESSKPIKILLSPPAK